jgi:basic membrane lipoprotein Med (substrate-binding protein (PBP1-ABC) superfamily)
MPSIKSNTPVRRAVAAVSNTLWATKRHAVGAVVDALACYGYKLVDDYTSFANDNGSATIAICDDHTEYDNNVKIAWYRFESGRYEFTTYIT